MRNAHTDRATWRVWVTYGNVLDNLHWPGCVLNGRQYIPFVRQVVVDSRRPILAFLLH